MAVADLNQGKPPRVVNLRRSVNLPSAGFVEPASPPIRLQHPQDHLAVTGLRQPAHAGLHQQPPGTATPVLRRQVDGSHLPDGSKIRIRVPARRDGDVAHHPVDLVRQHEDAGRLASLPDPLPPFPLPLGRIEPVKVLLRDLSAVRLPPAANMNDRQRLGIVRGRGPDVHSRHHATAAPTRSDHAGLG